MKVVITFILLVLVIGGFMYIKSKNQNTPQVQNQQQSSESAPAANSGKKIAFSKFVEQEGSYKCDVNQYIQNNEYKGVVYVNNGKIRGDYTMEQQGKNINISFIAREGLSYTWTDVAPTGFISRMRMDVDTQSEGETTGSYSWNVEQIGDYNCESFETSESQFIVPSNITFTEVKGKAVLN